MSSSDSDVSGYRLKFGFPAYMFLSALVGGFVYCICIFCFPLLMAALGIGHPALLWLGIFGLMAAPLAAVLFALAGGFRMLMVRLTEPIKHSWPAVCFWSALLYAWIAAIVAEVLGVKRADGDVLGVIVMTMVVIGAVNGLILKGALPDE